MDRESTYNGVSCDIRISRKEFEELMESPLEIRLNSETRKRIFSKRLILSVDFGDEAKKSQVYLLPQRSGWIHTTQARVVLNQAAYEFAKKRGGVTIPNQGFAVFIHVFNLANQGLYLYQNKKRD